MRGDIPGLAVRFDSTDAHAPGMFQTQFIRHNRPLRMRRRVSWAEVGGVGRPRLNSFLVAFVGIDSAAP